MPLPLPPLPATHDTGLFSLAAPAGWTLQRLSPESFLLSHPAAEISLTLQTIPHDFSSTSSQRTIDVYSDMRRFLAGFPHVKVRRPPHTLAPQHHPILCADGLQRLPAHGPWLWRLLVRGPIHAWRFYTILGPRASILARAAADPHTLQRFAPTLDRIISSIYLPSSELLTGNRFSTAVLSLAQNRFPDALLSAPDPDTLRIGASSVSLRALRLRYLEAPSNLPEHARTFFASLSAEIPAADLADEWSTARDSILPSLLTPDALSAAPNRLVAEQWINGLHVGYVLERATDPERPVTTTDADHWGVSADTLHDHALTNLFRRSRDHTMQGQKTEHYTMLVLAAPDPHNAARILLPEFYRRLRAHLGGTFYAALPTRELLVAFTADKEELRTQLRSQIARDYSSAKGALSTKLFLVTPDGIAGDPDEVEDLTF